MYQDFCPVAPSPELAEELARELDRLRNNTSAAVAANLAIARTPRPFGFDDGVNRPPAEFAPNTPAEVIRNAAADRAPLRGQVRVVVVLVDFADKPMAAPRERFHDLFFSTGVLPHGSVKEYYHEVTGGLVDVVGDVVGPYRMPQALAWYANGNYGIGRPTGTTRARDMAHDAAVAADADVDFGPYDNDGNGYVDAFVVVHAGKGGEEHPSDPGEIWSHKWVLTQPYATDRTKIYGYLTIPETGKLGVCAHELGHLLFGFPDLYDTDYTSSGMGDWCLMGSGSWNGGGDVPAHPSAWCKAAQRWVDVVNVTGAGQLSIGDVKTSRQVYRLWHDGVDGPEYFLVENRQRSGYDAALPGAGLLLTHVDNAQPDNTDETHYKVGLVQADALADLEHKRNRGDAGDPYPGTSLNTAFTPTSNPSSRSYLGQDSAVTLTRVSDPGVTMTAAVSVGELVPAPVTG